MTEEKTEGRKELEQMYDQDDCMLDCILCGENERPSLEVPWCEDCKKRMNKDGAN